MAEVVEGRKPLRTKGGTRNLKFHYTPLYPFIDTSEARFSHDVESDFDALCLAIDAREADPPGRITPAQCFDTQMSIAGTDE